MHRLHVRYGRATATSTSCGTVGPVRWVRRAVVALALAAPVVAVTAIAWPEGGFGGGDDRVRQSGSGPDGALVAGDEIGGDLGFGEVATYRVRGPEDLVVAVTGGPNVDATLTVVAEDGSQLAYNDDTNGLDPEVSFSLDDGEEADVEVRELNGRPGGFTLEVREVAG